MLTRARPPGQGAPSVAGSVAGSLRALQPPPAPGSVAGSLRTLQPPGGPGSVAGSMQQQQQLQPLTAGSVQLQPGSPAGSVRLLQPAGSVAGSMRGSLQPLQPGSPAGSATGGLMSLRPGASGSLTRDREALGSAGGVAEVFAVWRLAGGEGGTPRGALSAAEAMQLYSPGEGFF